MLDDTVQEYTSKLKDLKDGKITDQEWMEYCASILADVMDANRDVYIRMKERGD